MSMNFNRLSTDDKILIMEGAQVLGDVVAGEGTAFWYNSVCRGEMQSVRIGKRCNIQDLALIHNKVTIGDDVSAGHCATVHGATIGDRVIVVVEAPAVHNVEKVLVNAEKNLNEPNIAAIFIGIILGLAVGAVPLHLPGISAPVRLGLAGGPIIVGILIGTFGPRLHMITYTTLSANLMLREIGIALFLAAVGIGAGDGFIDAIVDGGYRWIGYGVIITVLPLIIVALVARRWLKMNYYPLMGLIAGSTTDPPALAYANATAGNDMPAVGYSTVYPVVMFLRVLTAQIFILFAL